MQPSSHRSSGAKPVWIASLTCPIPITEHLVSLSPPRLSLTLSRGNMSSRWILLPALASYSLSLWLCFLTCSNGASDNTYTLLRRVWKLGPSCCFPSEEKGITPLNQHTHRHTQPNWDENKSTFIVIVVDVSGDAGGFFGGYKLKLVPSAVQLPSFCKNTSSFLSSLECCAVAVYLI